MARRLSVVIESTHANISTVTANSIYLTSDRDYGFYKFKISGNGETAGPLWGGVGFTFEDLIDWINPLQHVLGVTTLYRKLTGD